jgi:hypothetical protein
LLRPYVAGLHADGRGSVSERLRCLAQQSAGVPVACVAGDSRRLLAFFDHLKRHTGRDRVSDTWPGLTAVLFTREPGGPGHRQLAAAVEAEAGKEPVLFLETCVRPEGAVAVEDPRRGVLRVLPHHGVYFEFVPVTELHLTQPTRHGLHEVEPGVPYAVAVTSPAGLWACKVGVTVCFERRDPPLLRLLPAVDEPARPEPVPARTDAARVPYPLQPPHPRAEVPGVAFAPGGFRIPT